ncbi:MAG TPA: hypothetical protein VMG99_09105 [Thermoplasmata archaeon]|nr:hypothetical protein [Thermoplasmata archaeon]
MARLDDVFLPMGRVEALVRQSDELAAKLRSANTAVQAAQRAAEAAQQGLTTAVRALRSRMDEYNALHRRYRDLNGELLRARQAAQAERVRTNARGP